MKIDNSQMTDAQAIAISASNIYTTMLSGLTQTVQANHPGGDHYYLLHNSGKYSRELEEIEQRAYGQAISFFKKAQNFTNSED